jgi:hypothetical protein
LGYLPPIGLHLEAHCDLKKPNEMEEFWATFCSSKSVRFSPKLVVSKHDLLKIFYGFKRVLM